MVIDITYEFRNNIFFFFSSIVLTSAIFVIYSTNTIYSAFFLILAFTNSTGLLLISEVEFLSIMLIIIYVGAITVLFLFVIMMLDINVLIDKNNSQNLGYIPIILLISFIFFLETFLMFSKVFTTYYHLIEQSFFKNHFFYKKFITQYDYITNVETIGHVLYTYYAFFFLSAGIILLIALIGAVTLTKKEKKKESSLTKNLYKQLSRNPLKAIFNVQTKN
jgi:NADH-quinone oxidoreductase subunit J